MYRLVRAEEKKIDLNWSIIFSLTHPCTNTVINDCHCFAIKLKLDLCRHLSIFCKRHSRLAAAKISFSISVDPLFRSFAISSYSPQMTNGNPLGQPPLKRHALDSSLITSGGSGVANTSGMTLSTPSTQQTLSALYGYSGTALPNLTAVHHQNLPTAPTYYQQSRLCMFFICLVSNVA